MLADIDGDRNRPRSVVPPHGSRNNDEVPGRVDTSWAVPTIAELMR